MSVWLDNHGLHGCASLTFGKPEKRRTLVKPIRVIRGYEMSWLQRLDRLRVKEEVEKADVADAVVVDVLDGHRGAVDHNLAEVVARMLQGEGFLGHLLRIWNHPCRLDVDALVAAIDDEVDFVGVVSMAAVCRGRMYKRPDIDGIAVAKQFIVDDVLHQVRVFDLTEVEPGVSKPCIRGVVFDRIVKVSIPLDVKALCLGNEKGIGEVVEVFDDGITRAARSQYGLNGVGEFRRIGQASDVAHGEIDHRIENCVAMEVPSFDDVLEIDRLVKIFQVAFLVGLGVGHDAFGKSAVDQVIVHGDIRIGCVPMQLEEFVKGERRYGDDLSTAAEFRGDIAGEHFGIGTRNIDIDVGHGFEFAQDAVELDIAVLSVIGMNTGKVYVFRKIGLAELNLVNEDIRPLVVMNDLRAQMGCEAIRPTQVLALICFKIDFYDVVFGDARLEKVILEKSKKQKTFATASYACQYLDESVVFCPDKFFEQFVAFNGHGVRCDMFLCKSSKLSHQVVYHCFCSPSMGKVNFGDEIDNHHRHLPFKKVSIPLFLKADGIVAFPTLRGKGDKSKLNFKEAA